jgi:hypothetical protein
MQLRGDVFPDNGALDVIPMLAAVNIMRRVFWKDDGRK